MSANQDRDVRARQPGRPSTPAPLPGRPRHAEIHDPAIAREGGRYYIFGTHRRFASSPDLVDWDRLECNITRDYEAIFDRVWRAWPKQAEGEDVAGNMWAPDVIWNPVMGRWCMYMSVNGAAYRSCIVLLTAEHLDGDWTLVGPVVYSGFAPDTVEATDVPRVLGTGADLDRYRSLKDTRINAIDAGVAFDGEGRLWMNFGSWFGGVWLLELDPATGLRRYGTSYPTIRDRSDAYYGCKLAGGRWVSGEGSYLVHRGGWWYLFLSYGRLDRTGGYQVRLFRSPSITGPYLDQAGQDAVADGSEEGGEEGHNWTGPKGIRLMSTCRWAPGPHEDADIEVAQGHNSVLCDDDGSLFIVFHTRFIGRGEDEIETRIHQLLPTDDGWLTVAPFEYRGVRAHPGREDLAPTDLVGGWQVVTHRQETFFDGRRGGISGDYLGVNHPAMVNLAADGTLTWHPAPQTAPASPSAGTPAAGSQEGDAARGTWSFDPDRGTIRLALPSVTYRGVATRLPDEAGGDMRVCLSAIGGNLSIWGARTETA